MKEMNERFELLEKKLMEQNERFELLEKQVMEQIMVSMKTLKDTVSKHDSILGQNELTGIIQEHKTNSVSFHRIYVFNEFIILSVI